MRNKSNFGMKAGRVLLGGLLLALPAAAQVEHRVRDWAVSAPDYINYVNFGFNNAATGRNYSTWTDPHGHPGVKYLSFEIANQSNPTPACFEVMTVPVSGTLMTTDTRIYFKNSATTWMSASDDCCGGTNYTSKVRMWMPQARGTTLRIQGRDASKNNIDFKVNVYRMQYTSSATCEDVGDPFLDFTNSNYPVGRWLN